MGRNEQQEETLRRLLREEAGEHLAAVNEILLRAEATEADRAALLLDAMGRMHSLKGAAAAVGFVEIQQLCHNWESCAQAAATGQVQLDERGFAALYLALDTISARLQYLCGASSDAPDPNPSLQELRQVFGDACTMVYLSADAPATAVVQSGDADTSLRVMTRSIDRILHGVGELLSLRSASWQHLRAVDRLLALVEQGDDGLRAVRESLRGLPGGEGGPQLAERLDRLEEVSRSLVVETLRMARAQRAEYASLAAITERLQDDVRSVRMVPAASVLRPLERIVRDLARAQRKRVVLDLRGGEVEVDRDVLEAIKDPLVHLLRNAVDHGIEPPEERARAGKGETGTITIELSGLGGSLMVEVRDDGRGIAAGRVRQRAAQRGHLPAAELEQMDDPAVRNLVFRPGFSTSEEVSEVSGRGVGLDVVRQSVERIGGRVELDTTEGSGTAFRLIVPVSLATAQMLLVACGEELFALPLGAIERVMQVAVEEVRTLESGLAIEIGGRPAALYSLADIVGATSAPGPRRPGIVVSASDRRVVLLVDRIVENQELMLRGLADHHGRIPGIAGTTVLSSGRILPVIGVAELVRDLSRAPLLRSFTGPIASDPAERKRILVVDDSITTRTLEKTILEAAGYTVQVANDGLQALQRLAETRFDLILSDVQMPRMGGVELAAALRSREETRDIPIVLVSSLASAADQQRGLDAGASAYVVKGEFNQEALLRILSQLL
jgi:two-component system chemotaxis sensor kinase CheA